MCAIGAWWMRVMDTAFSWTARRERGDLGEAQKQALRTIAETELYQS